MEKVKQFLKMAKSDNEDVAKYYLELSNGNVQKAVEMLIEDADANSSDECTPEQLSVLEWNIQGLLESNLSQRLKAILSIINQHQPSVIMLQEVIMSSYHFLHSNLQPKYKSYTPIDFMGECGAVGGSYFTAIFLNTEKLTPVKSGYKPFYTSSQGRDILMVEARCEGRDILLMTSHLESTREGEDERKNQLLILYNRMKQARPDCTVIFGGDTNLRDSEFNFLVHCGRFDVNLINDVWTMLGSPQDCRFSWDLINNDNQIKDGRARLRFERLYTVVKKESNKKVFKPRGMKFVGTDRLPCGLFPSDHWGILAHFGV